MSEEEKKEDKPKEQPPTIYLTPEPCIVKLSALFSDEDKKEEKKQVENN